MTLLFRFILILLPALAAVGAARADQGEEDRVSMLRAAFVMNFMKFTQWPENAMPGENEPFELVVVGDARMASALAKTLAERQVQGRSVRVKAIEWPGGEPSDSADPSPAEERFYRQLSAADALYIDISGMDWVKAVARHLHQAPTLMIASELGAIDTGVHLAMGVEGGKIVFEAAIDAIKTSPLSISSRLLKLARKQD